MKIGIIGVGAMACLFAARLSSIAEVILIGSWKEQIKALRHNLKVINENGTKNNYKIRVTSDVSSVDPVDLAIILVKSYQTKKASNQAKEILENKSPLNIAITMQNGLGNWEKLCAEVGTKRAIVGVTTQAAMVVEPGVVRDTGKGIIYLGNCNGLEKKTSIISDLFINSGWQVDLVDDMQSLIWTKLAINAAINPITAILNQKNGFLHANLKTRMIMNILAHETIEVANAQGITIPFTNNIDEHMAMICQSTSNNQSSMLRDILRGARTEIDAICGEIISKGKELSIPTPMNQTIYELVKNAENHKMYSEPFQDILYFLQKMYNSYKE